jgi:hypothetical protein
MGWVVVDIAHRGCYGLMAGNRVVTSVDEPSCLSCVRASDYRRELSPAIYRVLISNFTGTGLSRPCLPTLIQPLMELHVYTAGT